MSILKKPSIGFTQVSNEIFNDEKLSFKAKGLYGFLMSKPDGWNFEANRIAGQSKDGRRAVLNGLTELEENGYLVRRKQSDGRLDYELFNAKSAECQNRRVPKAHGGETDTISNKDLLVINNISNKENKGETKKDTPIQTAYKFFNNDDDLQTVAVDYLETKGMARPTAIREMTKFIRYWTELNASGKKQRWQTEKTFEVGKRLATWVMKAGENKQFTANFKGREIIGL